MRSIHAFFMFDCFNLVVDFDPRRQTTKAQCETPEKLPELAQNTMYEWR